MASPRREVDRPLLALIGRPNAGKSTLFNRLIRKRRAIVDDVPGITRDRLYGTTEWEGYEFDLVDCGGIGEESEDPLWEAVAANSRRAIEEADAVVFMVDTRTGRTTADDEVLKLLRRAKKPVIVAANKVESVKQQSDAYEFYNLGYADVIPTSGLTGAGVGELLEAVTAQIDWSRWPEATPEYFKWRYYQGPHPSELGGRGPDDAERARIAQAIADHEAARAEWDEAEAGEAEAASPVQPAAEASPEATEPADTGRPQPDRAPATDADGDNAEYDFSDAEDFEADYPFAFADDNRPRFVPDESWRAKPVRLVLVGKQNAGKSSLTNALLGEERALVNELAGTTRDPLFAEFERDGTRFEILDTAGMKRVTRIKEDVDYYSLIRAEKSLRYTEVALLVIDITLGVTEQDKRIASKIADDAKAVVIVANKSDLLDVPEGFDYKATEAMYTKYLREELDELTWAEVVYTSALKGRGLPGVTAAAVKARENYHKRIDNNSLREVLTEAITLNPPPIVKNRELRFTDFRQIGNCPPAILIEVNDKLLLRTSYKRFIHNTLRKRFDFTGTHLNLVWYSKRKKRR
jgi:GTP-binding protein